MTSIPPSTDPDDQLKPYAEPGERSAMQRLVDAWQLMPGTTSGPPSAVDPGRTPLTWAAWNASPEPRCALVELPLLPERPASVRDEQGARHPLQYATDEDGTPCCFTMLTLGALQATTLTPQAAAIAAAPWEVSTAVLDNGLVRVEFDPQGGVRRLSWQGIYADWLAPACLPWSDGQPMPGPVQVAVLEAGPVRAVLQVERPDIRLRFQLLAHAATLQILAWSPHAPAQLSLPLRYGPVPLLAGDARGHRRIAHDHEGIDLRWVSLGDALGNGLALSAAQPFDLVGVGSDATTPRTSRGLAVACSGHRAWSLSHSGSSADLPPREPPTLHHRWSGPAQAALYRLVSPAQVEVEAVAPHAGWTAQLWLRERLGCRSRCYLFPRRDGGVPLGPVTKLDAEGRSMAGARATPEGDGYQIDLGPDEQAVLRYRVHPQA